MMDNLIIISNLNDYVFCPISIYFHNLYQEQSSVLYQSTSQTKGKNAHRVIDSAKYSSRKEVISGISVYSEQYGLVGKIDILDNEKLIERKKKINKVYDGYVFQLYGQCVALREMGYIVSKIALHSMDDNKNYWIPLPEDDLKMFKKFEETIYKMRFLDVDSFQQKIRKKCINCIYEAACDRSLL